MHIDSNDQFLGVLRQDEVAQKNIDIYGLSKDYFCKISLYETNLADFVLTDLERHCIVASKQGKISLVAYERFSNGSVVKEKDLQLTSPESLLSLTLLTSSPYFLTSLSYSVKSCPSFSTRILIISTCSFSTLHIVSLKSAYICRGPPSISSLLPLSSAGGVLLLTDTANPSYAILGVRAKGEGVEGAKGGNGMLVSHVPVDFDLGIESPEYRSVWFVDAKNCLHWVRILEVEG